jgi:adenylate kinase
VVILLFGPPGSGKGTQSKFIAERFRIPAISTGDMFRAEMQADTPLGLAVKSIMAAGGLVGDDIVDAMVANRIGRPDCRNGFLLDGYPRTVPQAVSLDNLLGEKRFPPATVIHLDVPSAVLVPRLTARRQCPRCKTIYNLLHQPPARDGVCDLDGSQLIQREDDREDVIRARLKAYEESTGPVVDHYASTGAYYRIDGTRAPDEIFRQVESLLLKLS